MLDLGVYNKFSQKPWYYESTSSKDIKDKHSPSAISGIFKKLNFPKMVGRLIAKKILFVKNENRSFLPSITYKKQLVAHSKLEPFKISVQAGKIIIDGSIILPNNSSNKYIVVFNGINDRYDNHVEALKKLADDTGSNVVAFDYRSVGNSRGTLSSKDDLIQDGKMILEYLQKQHKAIPENILLYGHSLGGGVAAEVHAHVNHKGALVSEASFSSFSAAVKARKGDFLASLVKFSNWDMKPLKPFQDATKKGIILTRKDPIVRHHVSLYKALKRANKGLKRSIPFHFIKVGRDTHKENYQANVKYKTVIHEKEPSQKSGKSKAKLPASEFAKQMALVKKLGLLKKLPFPHDRLMDRVCYFKPSSSKHSSLDKIQNKLYQEDRIAYRHSVDMFIKLLA